MRWNDVSVWATCSIGLLALVFSGCDKLLYRSAGVELPKIETAWDETEEGRPADSERYRWPLKGRRYIVTKPPPMAYLTSTEIERNAPSFQPNELQNWDDHELGEQAIAFLAEAFDPMPTEMNRLIRIPASKFNGDAAYDISPTNNRLVLLEKTDLVLHDLTDGKRIGSLALPGDWSGSLPSAVAFCGNTRDVLVASTKQVCRISGKNGSVLQQIDWDGDPIVKIQITPDDKTIALLTENGRVFTGLSELDSLSLIESEYEPISDIGLSFDGRKLLISSDKRAIRFNLVDGKFDGDRVIRDFEFERPPTVAAGISSVSWMDQQRLVAFSKDLDPDKQQKATAELQEMYWRPHLAVPTTRDYRTNSFLMVGRRVIENRLQWILFDYGPVSRNFSVPIPLASKPKRMDADQSGSVVGLLDADGLEVFRRQSWRTVSRIFLHDRGYAMVNSAPMEEFEKLYDVIGQQQKWSAFRSPSGVQTVLLRCAANRWNYLEQHDENRSDFETATLEKFVRWHAEGSVLAKTVSGFRHHSIAWEARGTGTVNTVSQSSWETFAEHNRIADEELTQVYQEAEIPPSLALDTLIQVRMDRNNDLAAVDSIAGKHTKLYPGDLGVAVTIAIKLLPQWHGTPGDVISLIDSHSNLFEGEYSAVAYSELFGKMVQFHYNPNSREWDSVDIERVMEGIRTRDRAGWPFETTALWQRAIIARYGQKPHIETIVRLMMKNAAFIPRMTNSTPWASADLIETPDRIFEELLWKERSL